MTMQVTGLNNFKVTNYQTIKQNPKLRYRGFKNDKISYGTRVGMTSTEKLAWSLTLFLGIMSGLFGLNYKIAEANSTKPIEEKCDWIKKNLGDGFAKGTYGNPYFNGYNNQDEFSYGMKYNENIYSVRKNCTNMPSVNY